MKGLIKVTPQSINEIIDSIHSVMEGFNKDDYLENKMVWSWRKFKKVEFFYYRSMSFWYQYKDSLISHFQKLRQNSSHAERTGDEIWLSELSYTHLIKMANGDKYANPIYIMNY